MAKNSPIKKSNGGEVVRCEWGLLCSMSSIDQQRNNISLFNVIDELNLPSKIFELKQENKGIALEHEIVTLWRRTITTDIDDRKLEFDLSVSLNDPQGKTLQQMVVPLVFESGKRRIRFRIQISGLPISIPGDYVYTLEIHSLKGTVPESRFVIPFEVKILS